MVILVGGPAEAVAVKVTGGNEPLAADKVLVPTCVPRVQRALAVPSDPVKLEAWSAIPPPDMMVHFTATPTRGFPV
jgi:hypothetical protein